MTTPARAVLSEDAAGDASPGSARSGRLPSATCSSGSATGAIRSSRSSRARRRSSTRAGNEIIRHGASGFLGEINLLSGQTVYLTAVVTQPMRYIAVDRDDLRPLLFDDGPLADLLLSTFSARREALQRTQGIGIEVIGPRSSEPTRRIVDYARRSRLPYTWRDPEHADGRRGGAAARGARPD